MDRMRMVMQTSRTIERVQWHMSERPGRGKELSGWEPMSLAAVVTSKRMHDRNHEFLSNLLMYIKQKCQFIKEVSNTALVLCFPHVITEFCLWLSCFCDKFFFSSSMVMTWWKDNGLWDQFYPYILCVYRKDGKREFRQEKGGKVGRRGKEEGREQGGMDKINTGIWGGWAVGNKGFRSLPETSKIWMCGGGRPAKWSQLSSLGQQGWKQCREAEGTQGGLGLLLTALS